MQEQEGNKHNSNCEYLKSTLMDAAWSVAVFLLSFVVGLIMTAIGLLLYF